MLEVLIVEKEISLAAKIITVVEELGHTAYEYSVAREVIDVWLLRGKFDLMIIDGNIDKHPNAMDVIEAFQRLNPGKKVIFISNDPGKLDLARSEGCDTLQRPFDMDALLQLILKIT
ncbi:hypothetical protein KKF61_01150 [Patescibacteria group bacterium]|nr:hypothetical protein [Patescibacteria group bacterium]MBU0964095.1 hypothetical protein [Patescibacteria group bacterium]